MKNKTAHRPTLHAYAVDAEGEAVIHLSSRSLSRRQLNDAIKHWVRVNKRERDVAVGAYVARSDGFIGGDGWSRPTDAATRRRAQRAIKRASREHDARVAQLTAIRAELIALLRDREHDARAAQLTAPQPQPQAHIGETQQ